MKTMVDASPKPLTSLQKATLRANFDKVGPFYFSKDLHSMIDCNAMQEACVVGDGHFSSPFGNNPSRPFSLLPMDVSSNLYLSGTIRVIREEFFGGICIDGRDWREYMLDHCAFQIVSCLMDGEQTADSLLNLVGQLYSKERLVGPTLQALWEAGLVCEEHANPSFRFFPKSIDGLNYLQMPSVAEIELTYGCFRSCRHCAYNSSPSADTSRELDAGTWTRVLNTLAHEGVYVVQFTGGDPFFRPDVFEILESADRAGLGILVRSDTVAILDTFVQELLALKNVWHVGTRYRPAPPRPPTTG